ncbi:MAG TPA: hypothetical protein PLZ93_01105 [Nocardioides sp.]|uniref:hypothetical protein n=1 Tax=uncultured Nocardioides sp. TaxID=198441 RepID=UPI000EC62DCD|nr:hypothetical protein [uncultured Nocardioides sp.]HCB03137.1 hypothetical protein [Nocardioides sp.]HRD60946.1 hypothetical protein [Nocardioides sp.]HRI94190.1 hypothetical protein [Nocardioides sp.]HRK44173.1 hypothetical protein [Nocardioides sp.]
MTTDTTIDLADFTEDPLTQVTLELHRLVASWPVEVRDEVLWLFGELAISCSKGSKTFHRPAAEYLSLARRSIRLTGQLADESAQPLTREGAEQWPPEMRASG